MTETVVRPKVARRPYGLIIGGLLTVLLWACVIVALLQRQAIFDWWRLKDYQPPVAVAALASDTTMTDYGTRLFYVNKPQIEAAETFNTHCRTGEYTIVLGCYVSGDGGIYVFAVDDSRLSGIQQVTAAHEMLHAAYERLTTSERERINSLLEEAYDTVTDERVRSSVEQYRENDASVVPNELHSILGTEVRDLPAELEAYYAQYFTDRSVVVQYAESYESAFATRKQQIDTLALQLTTLRDDISSRNEALGSLHDDLTARYQDLEQSRDTMDASDFNQIARQYNDDVASYNAEVQAVNERITEFNAIYEQYEQVVLEQQDLFKAIDSRPTEISEE